MRQNSDLPSPNCAPQPSRNLQQPAPKCATQELPFIKMLPHSPSTVHSHKRTLHHLPLTQAHPLEPSNVPSQRLSILSAAYTSSAGSSYLIATNAPNKREYLKSLGQFINVPDVSSQDPSRGIGQLINTCGIEPTQGILALADRLHLELGELKRRREVHIQAMYEQLEALWRRMGVDVDGIEGFVEANRRSTGAVIQAYEEELERMIDLRRERMGEFIANARTEIESLWEELMVGDEQRDDDFAAFADGELLFPPRLRTCNLMKMNTDEHTEDLLSQHEHEIARLKAEVQLKMPLLTLIRKYIEICEENKELERIASDQTRLLGWGGGRDTGRLLREKKMRERVGKEKPKVCQFLFLLSCPSI